MFEKINNSGCDRSIFHVFSDAIEDAYVTVMYERNVYEDRSVSVSFIASKSKVAPLNEHGTPRLELQVRYWDCISAKWCLKFWVIMLWKSVFWCNSMNVLYWIKNPSRKFIFCS